MGAEYVELGPTKTQLKEFDSTPEALEAAEFRAKIAEHFV